MPRPGPLPPSQAFTVAPTSANSPLVHVPCGVPSRRVREQQRVLPRVVGRRRRRVAAVVGGDDQQVARPERLEDVLEPPVEVLQAAVEVDRVVAVAPEHVGLDEIHEDEAAVDLLQQLDGLVDPVDVRLRRERLVDVAAGEDVADLADAVHLVAGVADRARDSSAAAARARSRAGSACARSSPARRRTGGRSPARPRACRSGSRARSCSPRRAPRAGSSPRARRSGRRSRRTCRRSTCPVFWCSSPSSWMIVRPGRGLVAEDAAAGLVHERVDHVVREAVRVGRHRRRRDDPHQLPVTGRRVLALGALEQPAGDRGRTRLRRAALERHHVAEAERLERGQVEASDGAGDVAERVGALISE